MTFRYDSRLSPLLSLIETALVSGIPQAVERLKVCEKAYALFLWYHDSSPLDYCPLFGVGTKSVLNACAVQYPSCNLSRVDCIWRPQHALSEHSLIPGHALHDAHFNANCNQAYSLMLEANQTGLPLPDEGEILIPFRSMMRRAAASLNEYDWAQLLQVDPQFVVVALDWIGYWLIDDLHMSIPSAKVDGLKNQGLLFE